MERTPPEGRLPIMRDPRSKGMALSELWHLNQPRAHQIRKAPGLFPVFPNGLHTRTRMQRCTATRHVDTDTHTLSAQTQGLTQKYSKALATIHLQTLIPLAGLAPSHDSHLLSPLTQRMHLSWGPKLAEH